MRGTSLRLTPLSTQFWESEHSNIFHSVLHEKSGEHLPRVVVVALVLSLYGSLVNLVFLGGHWDQKLSKQIHKAQECETFPHWPPLVTLSPPSPSHPYCSPPCTHHPPSYPPFSVPESPNKIVFFPPKLSRLPRQLRQVLTNAWNAQYFVCLCRDGKNAVFIALLCLGYFC